MTTQPHLPPSCARRFRPTRVLAQGGFGTVWLAQQISLDRPVAVKVLHGEVLSNETAVKRFLKEAQVTAQVTHPNVVVLVDHDVEDGVPWIAYEYVPGRSLRSRLEGGALPWREAVGVAIQIASALEAAHAHGVLHRDIKPDNVLEADGGAYKVADFGIARTDSGKTLTAQGEIVGTPAYLSPVQLRGEVSGPESDIYALGVTLYEMLTGELPFQDDNVVRLLQRHIMQEPPRPSTKVEGLPRELDAIVLRALAKKREDRFDTVGQMRLALERIAGGGAPVAVGGGRGPRPVRDESGKNTRPAISRSHASNAIAVIEPQKRGRLAVAIALALAGLAALASFAWRREPLSRPDPAQVSAASPAPSVSSATTSLATAPRISELHLAVGDRSVIVTVRRDRPGELVVTVRPRRPSQDRKSATLAGTPLRGRVIFRKLSPEVEYELAISTKEGVPVASGIRFWTSTRRQGDQARRVTYRELLDSGDIYKSVFREALDPDQEPQLVRAIHEASANQGVLAELADLVRDLRSDVAARALADRLPETTSPDLRGALIGAMLYSDLPEAPGLALVELDRLSPGAREKLTAPLGHYPSAHLAGRLAKALDARPPVATTYAGVALARMDPEVASGWFEKWLSTPRDSARHTLATVAQQGLARLEPRLASPILERALQGADPNAVKNALQAAVRGGHRDLIAAQFARAPSSPLALEAAALFGVEATVPVLLSAARGTGEAAIRATAMLVGPAGSDRANALRQLLRAGNARIKSAAAWAAGTARVAEALPELTAVEAVNDPHHFALWARARLKDPLVGETILKDLERLVANPVQKVLTRSQLTRARLLAVAAVELDLRHAARSIRALSASLGSLDGCLSAALAALEGTAPARFYVMHPAAVVLRTGVSLAPGQSATGRSWALQSDQVGVDEIAGRFRSEGFLYTGDGGAWELKNAPHSFIAMVPSELLICRDTLVSLDRRDVPGAAIVIVLE